MYTTCYKWGKKFKKEGTRFSQRKTKNGGKNKKNLQIKSLKLLYVCKMCISSQICGLKQDQIKKIKIKQVKLT